jgi:hypothetical protein
MSVTTQLASTLEALTAPALIAYYPPPAPLAGVLQKPSTDPSVYRDDPNYIKLLNEQMYWKYAVDVPNRYTADRFAFACKQWEQAGKSIFLPLPPAYVVFDVNAFDQWWAQYVAKLGDAPPLFFIKPAALPAPPQILSPSDVLPPVPAIDGPIGAGVPFNPGVFTPSAADHYPDGYMYVGPTGMYVKHVFNNAFSVPPVRVVWVQPTF